MSRLEDKMAHVAQIAGRVTSDLEARADAVISREASIVNKSDRYFTAKHLILNQAEESLDKAESALKLLGNSDPLRVLDLPTEPEPAPG